MNNYFQRVWKTKSIYIIVLGLLILGVLVKLLSGKASVNNADMGIALGTLVSLVLLFGPVMYFDATNSKVANPKKRFVEPSLYLLVPLGLLSSALVFACFAALAVFVGPIANYIEAQLSADTFMGGFVMTFVILISLCGPGAFYTIYIRRHYKRVVEYDTTEWRRLRAKKKTG